MRLKPSFFIVLLLACARLQTRAYYTVTERGEWGTSFISGELDAAEAVAYHYIMRTVGNSDGCYDR